MSSDDEQFPFNDLFAPFDRIFSDFDRLFSGLPTIFVELDEQNKSSRPTSLRDQVLKDERSSDRRDENLDDDFGKIAASSSFSINQFERRTTPSGKCFVEKKIDVQQTNGETQRRETINRVCGELHRTTVLVDGKIVREYGNASNEQLDQIERTD